MRLVAPQMWLREWNIRRLVRLGERAMQRGRVDAALVAVDRAVEASSGVKAHAVPGVTLLLRARILARKRDASAVDAYLEARTETSLSDEDLRYIAYESLDGRAVRFRVYPLLAEWLQRASDPEDAQARLRDAARISSDDAEAQATRQGREDLNEYLAALELGLPWTMEHLSEAALARGDLERSHAWLAERVADDSSDSGLVARERWMAGRLHASRDEMPEAVAALHAAMRTDTPSAAHAARELLSAVKERRVARSGIRRVRRAFGDLATAPDHAVLFVDYARWIEDWDADAALAGFRKALDADPEEPGALWELATRLAEGHRPQEALDLLMRYVAIRPENDAARTKTVQLCKELGDRPKLIAVLEPARDRSPEQDVDLAESLFSVGRLEHAGERLADVEEEELSRADRTRARRLSGDVALGQGRVQEAIDAYCTLADESADDPSLLLHLGVAYLQADDCESAAAVLSSAVDQEPNNETALRARGAAYFRMERTSDAESDFRRAMEVGAEDADTLYSLAVCVLNHKPEEALGLLERVVDADPKRLDAWLATARAHELCRDWPRASDAYGHAASLSPNGGADFVDRHAHAALLADDFTTAQDAFAQLLDAGENTGGVRVLLGYCLFRTGDLREAARQFTAALLEHDDPELREDLAWLHMSLADEASARQRPLEVAQHWAASLEYSGDPAIEEALVQRWAREAAARLECAGTARATPRDAQVAQDLMADVLRRRPGDSRYVLVAAICAAQLRDWNTAEQLVASIASEESISSTAVFFLALCQWAQGLPDQAVQTLRESPDWQHWEVDSRALRTQVFLEFKDVERMARELAMLRLMAPIRCPDQVALAIYLRMDCWPHVYEIVQRTPPEARTDFMQYALGVAALMSSRETEGMDCLERVGESSEWWKPARDLIRTGYKRRALRAVHSLGWHDVVEAFEQVLGEDPHDDSVREWLTRARDFAAVAEWDDTESAQTVDQWRQRLQADPRDVRPLHQWAVSTYWDAQARQTTSAWRLTMSLWGTLLNVSEYWRRWARLRLECHDPETWGTRSGSNRRTGEVASVVRSLRQGLMMHLSTDVSDAMLRAGRSGDEVDDMLLDFLREYQTAALWYEWLEHNPKLRDSVLPYGRALLETLGRLREVTDILSTATKLRATLLTERLLIYLSPLGSPLAAVETGKPKLARRQAEDFLDSTDPMERRHARIVAALAVEGDDGLEEGAYVALEDALRCRTRAAEVADSPLLDQIDWAPVLTSHALSLATDVETVENPDVDERIRRAADARELLKRARDAVPIDALTGPVINVTLCLARELRAAGKLERESGDPDQFGPREREALAVLQEALSVAPEDLAVQRESAQLRYRRGLDAIRQGRANAAMIDFARAHDLDPVSHEISAQYAGFMMEQATHMWVSDSTDVQREALTLAHRALSVSPTDTQLLAACSRLLDLPDSHHLRQTPEYRRLATLFLRYAHDERRTESG